MPRFHNDRDDVVTEGIDGLLRTTPGLARLDGFPDVKVVVRADRDPDRVAVISGGGSGHEPAHAGYVGQGMLTAAVCGDVFASPSVDAIDAAIEAVCGEAGCLLVVKDYTGDRLNFGLAAERARERGHDVEVVIVGDDIARPDAEHPRGLAGTVLVHKVAGHLAEEGASLADVADAARDVADDLVTLGLALSTSTPPGSGRSQEFDDDVAEVGLGLPGEPGVERIDTASAAAYAELVADRLLEALGDEDRPLALVVNDLGAVPPLELDILTHDLLTGPLGDRVELVVGPARIMTSLNMNGFSATLLPLDDARRTALTSAVGPPAWRRPVPVAETTVEAVPAIEREEDAEASDDPDVRRVLEAVCDALEEARDELDDLDGEVGDGDTGATFAAAARSIRGSLDDLPLADPIGLSRALSRRLATAMGGSAGVLASLFFSGLAQGLDGGDEGDGSWADGVARGIEVVERSGGATQGDRTVLAALIPAAEALDGGDVEAAASAAEDGAAATAEMEDAKAGRSAYVGADALAGVRDPGAAAVARILRAIADATADPGA